MNVGENQLVVYQSDKTVRLDVCLENETVWLTQSQMATLLVCSKDNIGLHLKNVYAVGELLREATAEDFLVVRKEGARQVRRNVTCYNLDAIISAGYSVNSILGVKFSQWATTILKEYLLKGYAVNARLIKFIRRAKKDMIVIAPYVGAATLGMPAKRGRGMKIELVTHAHSDIVNMDGRTINVVPTHEYLVSKK